MERQLRHGNGDASHQPCPSQIRWHEEVVALPVRRKHRQLGVSNSAAISCRFQKSQSRLSRPSTAKSHRPCACSCRADAETAPSNSRGRSRNRDRPGSPGQCVRYRGSAVQRRQRNLGCARPAVLALVNEHLVPINLQIGSPANPSRPAGQLTCQVNNGIVRVQAGRKSHRPPTRFMSQSANSLNIGRHRLHAPCHGPHISGRASNSRRPSSAGRMARPASPHQIKCQRMQIRKSIVGATLNPLANTMIAAVNASRTSRPHIHAPLATRALRGHYAPRGKWRIVENRSSDSLPHFSG